MDNLTNDDKKLLCKIYNSYLEKRKSGMSKADPNMFDSCESIHKDLCKDSIGELWKKSKKTSKKEVGENYVKH